MEPPPIKPTFNGDLEKLPFFLNQVWAHFDRYAYVYLNDAMMVNTVEANLEGDVAEWVTNLHDEGAPELLDANLFMEQLRARFEDESQALQVVKATHHLKQKGHLAKEYVWAFQRVAGRLGQWPERSLIHYFKEGLDHDHDLAGAFSEKECDTLPPHQATKCAIVILPDAKLPKPKMSSMISREMNELR